MNNPSEQLENITEMITKARDAVYDGKSIDMTEIQGQVKEVCDEVQQNPHIYGEGIHDKVINIITNLNFLMEELEVQQKQVTDEATRKGYKKNQDEA